MLQHVPVLQNGCDTRYGNQILTTQYTCAFDSIFSIFVCLYADNLNFRADIDFNSSKFSELIKTFFHTTNSMSQSKSSGLEKVYIDRNIVLNDLYSNWCLNNISMNSYRKYIDCRVGIGDLYGRLCSQIEENIASVMEEKTCNNCDTKTSRFLPFLTLIPIVKNLQEVQNSIDVSFSRRRSCTICKNDCDVKKYYNNLLVLEVEPESQLHKNIALKNLPQTIIVDHKEYELCAAVNYDHTIKHFSALVRRLKKEWQCYDDIKSSCEMNTEDSEINPFLLFYISIKHSNDFKKSMTFVKINLDKEKCH